MHATHPGRAGFTLVETIGVVLISGILLAMAAPAIAHGLRVREAEAVLKNDLHNAANVYEQVYAADRVYPEFGALRARGLVALSPNVAVDSAAVSGERVYLRLRHVPTGQLCALDYSRSSAVARNRADCYGGGQERDTALAVTAEGPPAPANDTFSVAQAPPADTAENPLGLVSPTVQPPSPVSLLPGASSVATFRVTNPNAIARSYRLEVASSSPSLVASPPSPAPLTLLAHATAAVAIPVRMAADAPAEGTSVVPLRAVDVEDERWTGTASATVAAALALASPAVALTAPGTSVHDAGESFDLAWSVTNRSNAARVLAITVQAAVPAHATVGSADGTGSLPFGPGQTRTVTAHVTLSPTADGGTQSTVAVEAVDAEAPVYRSSAAGTVETRLRLAAPTIEAAAAESVDPGADFTLTWSVRNQSNAGRTYDVTASCGDPAHLEVVSSTGTGEQSIARGGALSVRVTYRVKVGSVAGRSSDARLQVADREAPELTAGARVPVTTNLVLANPMLVGPGPQQAKPGEEFSVAWTVQNATNGPRTLVIGVPAAPAELALVSADEAGDVPFQPMESRVVTARFRVLTASPAGARETVALTATDKAAATYTAAAGFDFTTALDVRSPRVTAPGDASANPGTAGPALFRIVNASNAPRTFVLATSSTNGAAALPSDAGPVTVPAFGSADVGITVSVPAAALGYAQARVVLAARDAEDASATDQAGYSIEVNPVYIAPALTWRGGRTVTPGDAATDTATLTNRSNVPVQFCFTVQVRPGNASAGNVVEGSPEAPACQNLAPAGSAEAVAAVPVRWSTPAAALAGETNLLTLNAEAGPGTGSLSASADLSVAAALVVRAPTWSSVPGSPMFWNSGEQRTLSYTFRNTSNGPRTFCVAIESADATKLAPVDASPVCGLSAGAGDTIALTHALQAVGAATGLMVTASVYDQDSPGARADATFANVIRDTRPVAVWDAPSPVYVRRWATFDGGRSSSPVGSPIASYEWTWGLAMQRWDPALGRFVATESWETASDHVATPVVQRAYDLLGTWQVCLRVVDAEGRRSDPNCQSVTTLRTTAARLAWRYRGWWTDKEWCLDVWWNNQCDSEHGNSRWEVDLRPSAGDVEIAQAYAEMTVALHNTDDPSLTYVYYAGNSGTTPQWTEYAFGRDTPEAVGRAQDGHWRVLSTNGTGPFGWPARPQLINHPLVLNVNLASATGAFDGGPHWVPDAVWVTLHVQDADGRWTTASAYHDHIKANWKAAYDTVVTKEEAPVATVTKSALGNGRYRFAGSGDSPEGRVVDAWWEVSSEPIGNGRVSSKVQIVRSATVDVAPAWCERVLVTFMVKDDRGQIGSAYGSVDGPGGKACLDPGGAV